MSANTHAERRRDSRAAGLLTCVNVYTPCTFGCRSFSRVY
jgi:hypothetical protein